MGLRPILVNEQKSSALELVLNEPPRHSFVRQTLGRSGENGEALLTDLAATAVRLRQPMSGGTAGTSSSLP